MCVLVFPFFFSVKRCVDFEKVSIMCVKVRKFLLCMMVIVRERVGERETEEKIDFFSVFQCVLYTYVCVYSRIFVCVRVCV